MTKVSDCGWDNEDAIYDCSALHPLEEEEEARSESLLEYDRLNPKRAGYWKTGTGFEIKISEMTDDHLCNALAYAERIGFPEDKIEELRAELKNRRRI